QPLDKLQVGIGVTLFSDTLGKIGVQYGANPGASMDTKLLPTNTLHAGVRAGPFDGFTTGLAYREARVTKLSFPTDLHASIGQVDGDIQLRGQTLEFYTPRQFVLGESWQSQALEATGDL